MKQQQLGTLLVQLRPFMFYVTAQLPLSAIPQKEIILPPIYRFQTAIRPFVKA